MLSILETCRCLNVSRASYYLFCQREPSNLEIENKKLAELLKEIFLEHKSHYWARKIKFILQKEYQLTISCRRITRLLRTQSFYTRDIRQKIEDKRLVGVVRKKIWLIIIFLLTPLTLYGLEILLIYPLPKPPFTSIRILFFWSNSSK